MSHIEFDMLYRLAEMVDDDQPFNGEEIKAMEHISNCKECYDKFSSIFSIIEVTSDSGYIALSNIFNIGNDFVEIEKNSKKVMLVISVMMCKIKNTASVMMKQVKPVRDGFIFEMPLAIAARNIDSARETEIRRLEDIENEKNYVIVDPSANELLVQVDTRALKGKDVDIYIIQESGKKVSIPVERIGLLIRGKLSKIPNEQFYLYIEEK